MTSSLIIANITGILSTLNRILWEIIKNFRAEISFVAHSSRHHGVNYIFAQKNITVPSIFDCPKHEYITVKTLPYSQTDIFPS